MHTLHLASPAPSASGAKSVWASPFSAGLLPSLPASAFPFFRVGTFSPCFAGAFLGLGFSFGGADFADKLVDLLCGSFFTLALSPLPSPSAFLSDTMVTAAGCRHWTWMQQCVRLVDPGVILASSRCCQPSCFSICCFFLPFQPGNLIPKDPAQNSPLPRSSLPPG